MSTKSPTATSPRPTKRLRDTLTRLARYASSARTQGASEAEIAAACAPAVTGAAAAALIAEAVAVVERAGETKGGDS